MGAVHGVTGGAVKLGGWQRGSAEVEKVEHWICGGVSGR